MHPLRAGDAHHKEARIADAPPVSGPRKRSSKAMSCSPAHVAGRSDRAARPAVRRCPIGVAIAALAMTAAKGLSEKVDRHQSAPASQRPPIDLRHHRQTRQAGRRRPELHRRDQRHHGGEVDPAAQKAQRRRGGALAASVHRATETKALGITLGLTHPGTLPRLAVAPRCPNAVRHRRASTGLPGRRPQGRGRRRATVHGTWRRPARLWYTGCVL